MVALGFAAAVALVASLVVATEVLKLSFYEVRSFAVDHFVVRVSLVASYFVALSFFLAMAPRPSRHGLGLPF